MPETRNRSEDRLWDSEWEDAKQLAGVMEVMAKRLMDGCDVPDGCCEPLPSAILTEN